MMTSFRIYEETDNGGVFIRGKRIPAANAREALQAFIRDTAVYVPEGTRFIVMQIGGIDADCHLLKLSAPKQTWDVVSA